MKSHGTFTALTDNKGLLVLQRRIFRGAEKPLKTPCTSLSLCANLSPFFCFLHIKLLGKLQFGIRPQMCCRDLCQHKRDRRGYNLTCACKIKTHLPIIVLVSDSLVTDITTKVLVRKKTNDNMYVLQ